MKGKTTKSSKSTTKTTSTKKNQSENKQINARKSSKSQKTQKTQKIQLKLSAPQAEEVVVAGDFNAWDTNGIKMKKNKRGLWKTDILVEPGKYEYKFIVDNEWWTDPENMNTVWNDQGSQNSYFELN